MSAFFPSAARHLSRHWIGRLAPYRSHRNDEHREALFSEALRYGGLRLEFALAESEYWKHTSLARRAAVLLYLVDRGIVSRTNVDGRYVYEADADAETWVCAQPALAAYVGPTLELIAALRQERRKRMASHNGV